MAAFPTDAELDLALPALNERSFLALRTLQDLMHVPTGFDARLKAWRATLDDLDPVFREDWLSDVLTGLVMQALEPHQNLTGPSLTRLAQAIDALLAEGAMLDHVPPTGGDYLLSRVTSCDHPARWSVALTLLERGANPQQTRNGGSPWRRALREQHEAFVLAALPHVTTGHDSALYDLLERPRGDVDPSTVPRLVPLVGALLDAGVETEGSGDETPFLHAVRQGYLEVAQALLDRGANAHATTGAVRAMDRDRGWTALHLMAALDRPEACEWLIERGLDPHARTFNRATPLGIAREHDAWRAAAVLERLELRAQLGQCPRPDSTVASGDAPAPAEPGRARARL